MLTATLLSSLPSGTALPAGLISPSLLEASGGKRRRAYFSQAQQDKQFDSETFNAPENSVT